MTYLLLFGSSLSHPCRYRSRWYLTVLQYIFLYLDLCMQIKFLAICKYHQTFISPSSNMEPKKKYFLKLWRDLFYSHWIFQTTQSLISYPKFFILLKKNPTNTYIWTLSGHSVRHSPKSYVYFVSFVLDSVLRV